MQKVYQGQGLMSLFGSKLTTNEKKPKALNGVAAIVVAFFVVILASLFFNNLCQRLEANSGEVAIQTNEQEATAFLPGQIVTEKISIGYFKK